MITIIMIKDNKMETIKELFHKFMRKLCLFFRRKIATEVTCTETVLSSSTNTGINYIVGNCTGKGPNITYVKSEEELLNLYKNA